MQKLSPNEPSIIQSFLNFSLQLDRFQENFPMKIPPQVQENAGLPKREQTKAGYKKIQHKNPKRLTHHSSNRVLGWSHDEKRKTMKP